MSHDIWWLLYWNSYSRPHHHVHHHHHNLVDWHNAESQNLFKTGATDSAGHSDQNKALNDALGQNIFGASPIQQAMSDLQHGMSSLNDAFSVSNYMRTATDLTADQTNLLNQRIQNDIFSSMLDFMNGEMSMAQNFLKQGFGQGGNSSQAGSDTTTAPAGTPAGDSPQPLKPSTGSDTTTSPDSTPKPGNVPSEGPTPASAEQALASAKIPPVPSDALNAKTFGATGDGSTDDTAAIQKAVDNCPPGGTVYVPDGTYMIDAKDGGIRMKSGVTLQMSQGTVLHAQTTDSDNGAVVTIGDGVSNVNVYGGTIQGDRATHQGNWGECLYGVGIYGASNVNVVGVTSKDNFGDGFCIDRGKNNNSSNIVLSNDVGINNRRDGLSVVGVDGAVIQNNVFDNNGGNDSIDPSVPACPQLPMCGIDVEPDPDKSTTNVIIRNNELNNNGTACDNVADNGNGFGLHLTGAASGTDTGNQVYGNVVENNAKGGIGVWKGNHTVSDNIIVQDQNGLIIYNGSADGTGNTLNGAPSDFSHG